METKRIDAVLVKHVGGYYYKLSGTPESVTQAFSALAESPIIERLKLVIGTHFAGDYKGEQGYSVFYLPAQELQTCTGSNACDAINWTGIYPNHCRTCKGAGWITTDEGDYETPPVTNECPDCTSQHICPWCLHPGLVEDADVAAHPVGYFTYLYCKHCYWSEGNYPYPCNCKMTWLDEPLEFIDHPF